MRFSSLRPFHLTLAFMAVAAFGQSEAATLCEASAIDSKSELFPYVAGSGELSDGSLILFGNAATQGLSESWGTSDPENALAWLRGLPNDERNNVIFVDLISVSLGSSEGWNDALHSAIEISRALAGNGVGIIEGDRYRGGSRDRGTYPSGIDPAYGMGSWIFGPVIPEPTTALLGTLGALSLLRRRRYS